MFDYGLKYRPTSVSDDEGGFTDSLGVGVSLWCAVEIYQGEALLSFRNEEDVKPGDIIGYGETYYRVRSIVGNQRGPYKSASIEKIARPIHVA